MIVGVGDRLRRLGRWMGSTVAPDPWTDAAQYCPRCHRPIPGGIHHPFPGWVIPGPLASTDAELLRLCPLDGPSGRDHPPQDRPIDELTDDVRGLAESLATDGEGSWAKMLASAAERDPDDERLTYMGHAVALLLERGPRHWWGTRTDRTRIRQLLSDIVVKWPAVGA